MKHGRRIALTLLLVVPLGVAGFTAWALEWSGVAIVETQAADGSVRSTHVWFVEPGGALWVEAGTPKNSWFLDVLRDPRLEFSADGRSGRYLARRVETPAARARIRGLLRQKYGIRDWWIGVLFDTSKSIAVELVDPAT